MITQENLFIHELIGLEATVLKSNNEQITGISGKIIDETKSMLFLNTINGIKKIPKEIVEWKFSFGKNESIVNGNLLIKRPQERLGGKT
ncbi:MAG TPA: ribonuclease P protein subunit [Nitrosopumilaceae archaeon]|nr:ribonuclease P protein subunit [Nitrosopumilaceae archaeon]